MPPAKQQPGGGGVGAGGKSSHGAPEASVQGQEREVSEVEGLKWNNAGIVWLEGTEREPLPLVAPVFCHCSISSSSSWPVLTISVTSVHLLDQPSDIAMVTVSTSFYYDGCQTGDRFRTDIFPLLRRR